MWLKCLNNSVCPYILINTCVALKYLHARLAVKGLQQRRPTRKWREPITARGVRRRRVTSEGVVRGLECYNVTIATGRFRLKRWNVTFYHRRRERVLYVERNRTTCRFVMYLRNNKQPLEDLSEQKMWEYTGLWGFIRPGSLWPGHHMRSSSLKFLWLLLLFVISPSWVWRRLLWKYFLIVSVDPEQSRWPAGFRCHLSVV